MDHPLLPHYVQTSQHLPREAADQCRAEAHKAVRFDQLVEVDAEQLGDDAKMVSKVEVVRDFDQMVNVLRILRGQNQRRQPRPNIMTWTLLTQSISFSKILTSTRACW